MVKAVWDTYRLGAKLPAMDSLVKTEAATQIEQLQRALSSVAYRKSSPLPTHVNPPSDDARFVGRLLLGLLCRGWPTFSSPAVEEALLGTIDPASGLSATKKDDNTSLIWQIQPNHPENGNTLWTEAILDALLRADRRLVTDEAEIALLTDSGAEKRFYLEQLAPLFGDAIGWLELQRPIESMLSEDIPEPNRVGSGRVDFSLELPGRRGPVRVVLELDGPHHTEITQHKIDNFRDRLLEKHDWTVLRISLTQWESGDFQRLPERVKAIIDGNEFPFSHISSDEKWCLSTHDREASRLILTPHAVARVQFGLTQALMDGSLSLDAPRWVIAVEEREVPCAEIALRDWLQTLGHLCRLYDIPVRARTIRLLVSEDHRARFQTPAWTGSLVGAQQIHVAKLTPHSHHEQIDLAIDVSVGAHPTRRFSSSPLDQWAHAISNKIILRTSQRQTGFRAEEWTLPRIVPSPMQRRDSLTYFLQYLFRKREFRDGQLPIVSKVLRRQDVIGLLPTGAGKSVTFQLPALLSPGLTLVLDPLKSLMQDQVENLRDQTGIMDAIQINSDTPTKDRAKIERQFSAGEYRLVFISPERLQIQEFRDRLRETTSQRPIAYFVVDEAHCVSEWGHDFRTAYLNLGRIAQERCSRSGERPPVVALTGTASESVLRDIQRELDIGDDKAIIRPKGFSRKELQFEIVSVPKKAKLDMLMKWLHEEIPAKLKKAPDRLASGEFGGLVFCPHVNGKLGVFEVANAISERLPQFSRKDAHSPGDDLVGFYSGEKPKKVEMANDLWAAHKGRLQRSFKESRTPLLVATKAFGMGIDKPNIRYTIHYSMAQSIEAFAQEAGRAGRDHQTAICAVLFTDRLNSNKGADSSVDCLEPGISVEEASKRAEAASWDGDDAEIQMFLHARSYPGVQRESEMVRSFYHKWIEPVCSPGNSGIDRAHDVTISEHQVKDHFGNSGIGAESRDQNESSSMPSGMGLSRPSSKDSGPDLQRIIYRLSLLGLVHDYTVRYQLGNDIYTLSLRPLPSNAVRDQLYGYVKRYRTSERLRIVEQHLADSQFDCEVCKAIDALCWFIYEEIELRRRQSIANMRQILRDSSDGAELSRRIDEFLSTTALTQTIFDVLAADDYRDWGKITAQITTADSAEHVYYQCRRALEDAPGHTGLILLQSLALLGSDSQQRSDVVSGLRFGLSRALDVFSESEYRDIVEWLLVELSRVAPVTGSEVISELIFASRDPQLARAVLRLVDAKRMADDSLAVHTASRYLLARIDARLETLITS